MNIKKIGVFATVGTVNSGAYKKELLNHNSELQVHEIACPNWVSIVEGLIENGEDASQMRPLLFNIENDPSERIDLSERRPEILEQMLKLRNEMLESTDIRPSVNDLRPVRRENK